VPGGAEGADPLSLSVQRSRGVPGVPGGAQRKLTALAATIATTTRASAFGMISLSLDHNASTNCSKGARHRNFKPRPR